MFPRLSFVIGGAASGKSDFGEKLISSSDLPKVYLATAQAHDTEMRTKIERHRTERGASWATIEAPMDAAGQLRAVPKGHAILLDCATLWLTNQMLADADLPTATHELLAALGTASGPVVVVSNEVGQGIVPETSLGRRFREAQGRLNRDIAAQADLVVGVMAGLPFVLKGQLPEGVL